MSEDNDGVEPHGGPKHVRDRTEQRQVAKVTPHEVHTVQVEDNVRLVALEGGLGLRGQWGGRWLEVHMA